MVYKKALDRPFCTLSLLAADGTQLEPPVRCAFVSCICFSQHFTERAAACRSFCTRSPLAADGTQLEPPVRFLCPLL